jgi:iron(III) transport system ATP-binding protein
MPHMLSGGQQQRVALVRALARGPAVMLLDEPFSGLDMELREKIRPETLALLQETQVATLMVTHDPQEAYVASDIISVMHGGRIVTQGRPDEVCQVTTLPSGLAAVRINTSRCK